MPLSSLLKRSRPRPALIWIPALVLAAATLPAQPKVVCAPEKPVVDQDEVISVSALAEPVDQTFTYQWTVTAGKIEGSGPEARWNFRLASQKRHTATVQVTDTQGRTAECSTDVELVEKSAGRGGAVRPVGMPRETGWSYLIGAEPEGQGKPYGLYSYLLLGSRPTPKSEFETRCLRAIEAYLRAVPNIHRLERDAKIDRSKLNITYLPVSVLPPDRPKDAPSDWAEQTARWILANDNYNYARARAFLQRIEGNHREGPYLVSYFAPLSQTTAVSDKVLFHDLSGKPPELVRKWVDTALNQAAQERYWEPAKADLWKVRVATALVVMGKSVGLTRDAMADWIKWVAVVKPAA